VPTTNNGKPGRSSKIVSTYTSAERLLHQASGLGPATEARLQQVVQGLHDRHADKVSPLNFFTKKTLRVDDYEELEKEREAFAPREFCAF